MKALFELEKFWKDSYTYGKLLNLREWLYALTGAAVWK
jgi:hypothetical protein